jgi:protein-L-isoaspartate(D-aspartate) O-methyltransferase
VNGFASRRDAMVRQQLEGRGISDPAVLAAFRAVPREAFVPSEERDVAYEDHPLPIGSGQTISQPYVVALMVQALTLKPTDHVLEVGAGSGYAAAVLSRIAADVVAVERIPVLAEAAAARLEELGYANVHVVTADGSTGVAGDAPFDAVCVSAGAPSVPAALVQQLAAGGRLVVPVGSASGQDLWRMVRRADGHVDVRVLGPVRFVPLMGEQGWHR